MSYIFSHQIFPLHLPHQNVQYLFPQQIFSFSQQNISLTKMAIVLHQIILRRTNFSSEQLIRVCSISSSVKSSMAEKNEHTTLQLQQPPKSRNSNPTYPKSKPKIAVPELKHQKLNQNPNHSSKLESKPSLILILFQDFSFFLLSLIFMG
ncbi:unnamed protein product [Trifolium pratense]|uniref:Uncharacterized protein n=1 Tax=Trifolium pratense TaxID=57577 RepID=A0ACB0IX58_TRIPR|nr:unnamed protein product [Trifolium pratense]